jgi:hypothetical protein
MSFQGPTKNLHLCDEDGRIHAKDTRNPKNMIHSIKDEETNVVFPFRLCHDGVHKLGRFTTVIKEFRVLFSQQGVPRAL